MQDEAQIRSLIAPWIHSCIERDWDALLAICSDSVVFAPPGEPQVSGRDAIRTWLDAFPVIKAFSFDFENVELSGPLAVAIGAGSMSVEIDGEQLDMSIKFSDVLRKQPDGTWRFTHVIWNTDEPQ